MTKLLSSYIQIDFIMIAIIFFSITSISQAVASHDMDERKMTVDSSYDDYDDNNVNLQEQQRIDDLNKKLRYFLLTSNAEQRAARRKQQNSLKRELIREYLKSASDSGPDRLQEIKKRFCASLDEFYATQAACLG